MKVIKLALGQLNANCYLAIDDNTGKALIVDPTAEGEKIARVIYENGLNPVMIVDTHCHFDHIGANAFLKNEYNIPIAIHKLDVDCLRNSHIEARIFSIDIPPSPEPDILLNGSETIEVGNHVFEVIHTPGHTPGSICLYERHENILFTGDTLFFESVGRWDLIGGDYLNLMKSLKKLLKLPSETRVFPGHGPETTIGHEKEFNPFLNKV